MENIFDNHIPSIDTWELDISMNYGGSERKEGLISPNGKYYMIKYAKNHTGIDNMDSTDVNNILSEYIASHVLQIAGFPTHNTFIATRNQELVVVCENFLADNTYLLGFDMYMRKYYESGQRGRVPDITQIKFILNHDSSLQPKAKKLYSEYWERFVADALIGIPDRHIDNWGYILDARTKTIINAPIYDNGNALYPELSEKDMTEILGSPENILKQVISSPKAALLVNGQKVDYLDMLKSNYEPVLTDAVCRIVPKIQTAMPQIHDFISKIKFISDTRKKFYIMAINARMELLLLPAYKCCIDQK